MKTRKNLVIEVISSNILLTLLPGLQKKGHFHTPRNKPSIFMYFRDLNPSSAFVFPDEVRDFEQLAIFHVFTTFQFNKLLKNVQMPDNSTKTLFLQEIYR